MRTFLVPAILMLIAACVGIFAPETLGNGASAALNFTIDEFGWFYVLGSTFLLIMSIAVCFTKFGEVKLGGKDAKPEFSRLTWFSITLTSVIAIGIVFYGVAEPMTNFNAPAAFLGLKGGSAAAAEAALPYTLLHWGLHPYGIYTGTGLCLAFMYWNAKRRFAVSSALYPILGDRVDGKAGDWINAVTIFCVIGGVATGFGLGTMQFTSGLGYITGKNFGNNLMYLIVIAAFATTYILSACTGLHKGIALVSNINTGVYVIMLVFFFFAGGPKFILNIAVSTIGQYIDILPVQSFYLEPAIQSGWVGGNTVFYLAWWLAFAPIMALFLIRLAKGRTIREFIVMNLFAPVLFALIWFSIFGGSAIRQQLLGNMAIWETIQDQGIQVALFAFFKQYPFAGIISVLGLIAIALSFITNAEANVLTVAEMTALPDEADKGDVQEASPHWVKVFWGTLMAAVAFALMQSGGLSALQTSVIVCALPILVLTIFMVYAFLKTIPNYEKYDRTKTEEERTIEDSKDFDLTAQMAGEREKQNA
jgi:choline/carnitine/betaine transport